MGLNFADICIVYYLKFYLLAGAQKKTLMSSELTEEVIQMYTKQINY